MIYTLHAHGRSYRIAADPAGRVGGVIATGRPYEAPLLEWIWSKQLQGVAVDVGAHIGNHTLWFAVVCGFDVVYAFEPETSDDLERNIEINGANVRAEQCVLGATEGWAYQVAKGTFTTTMPEISDAEHLAVPMRTLDSFCLTDVSLIKIDVEGMEPEVLRGALETIEGNRPVLCIEARDEPAHAALTEILEPLGYAMTERFTRGTPLECWEPA